MPKVQIIKRGGCKQSLQWQLAITIHIILNHHCIKHLGGVNKVYSGK
jgi:hypothetical protein